MVVPAPDGNLNPLVLAAAELAGVHEIYRVGGAQAIAALAYGTETIAPVVKIVGPGNAYVAAAKRQVFGQVGIDMIAGPSEVVVIADKDNDPAWIAADLLAQAEHDAAAQVDPHHRRRGLRPRRRRRRRDRSSPRCLAPKWRGQAGQSFGAIILVGSLDRAPALADRLAPEHLEIATADPEALAGSIRNAGAIFLGRYTPEVIGDYVAGPEPRAAHRAQRPLRLGARRARFHEAHLDPQARRRELERARARRHDARPRRRARSPSPLRRHQAERAGLSDGGGAAAEELSPERRA